MDSATSAKPVSPTAGSRPIEKERLDDLLAAATARCASLQQRVPQVRLPIAGRTLTEAA